MNIISKSVMVFLISLFIIGSVNAIGTDDLVFYYEIDGDATDYIDSNLDGTVYGATLTTDRNANSNSAYDLDGSNDYITAPVGDDYDELAGWSISYWVNVDSWATTEVILGSGGSFIENYVGSGTGRTRFYDSASSNTNIIIDDFQSGVWVHVVVVFGSVSNAVYYNGVLNASVSASGDTSRDITDIVFGARGGSSGLNLDGKLDELAFWDIKLNSTAVSDLYTNGIVIAAASTASTTAVYVTPNNPFTIDNVYCNATPLSDTDASGITTTIAWYKNSNAILEVTRTGLTNDTDYQLTDLNSNNFTYTDIIKCGVITTDSIGDGPEVNSSAVTIRTGAVVSSSINLRPLDPHVIENIICDGTITTDLDSTPIAYFRWYINGTEVKDGDLVVSNNTDSDLNTLGYTVTNPSDIIKCGVIGYDGYINGTEVNSSNLIIRVPDLTLDTPVIRPDTPNTANNIYCNTTVYSSINTTPEIDYKWYINGSGVASGTYQFNNNTETDIPYLSSALTNPSDNIHCSLTPYDGYFYGIETNSSPVSISASTLTITGLTILPDPASSEQDLYCQVTVNSSVNATINIDWSWSVNGVIVSSDTLIGLSQGVTANITNLTSINFNEADIITCSINPFDISYSGEVNDTLEIQQSSLTISFLNSDGNELNNQPIIYTISNSTDTIRFAYGVTLINSTNSVNPINGFDQSLSSFVSGASSVMYVYVPIPISGYVEVVLKGLAYLSSTDNAKLELYNVNTNSYDNVLQLSGGGGSGTIVTTNTSVNNTENKYNGLGRISHNNKDFYEIYTRNLAQPVTLNLAPLNLPTGEVTVVVDDIDLYDYYYGSNYITTINTDSIVTLATYLVSRVDGREVLFSVYETITSNPVENVLVTAQILDGTYTTQTQGTTDGSGSVLLNLVDGAKYKMIYTTDGYISKEVLITISSSTYTSYLTQDYSLNYTNVLEGLSYKFLPLSTVFNSSGSVPINITYFDSAGNITNTVFNITYNGTLYNEQTSSTNTGTTLNINFDAAGKSGYVYADVYITIGNTTYKFSKVYYIDSVTPKGYSVQNLLDYVKTETDANTQHKQMYGLAVFLVILFITAAVSAISRVGAAVVGLGLAAILLVPIGILSYFQIALMFIVVIIISIIFGGVFG